MSDRFTRLTSEQFLDLVFRFPFRRRIDAVHMHHTWKPRRRDFRGHETIEAMRKYHVNTNGWSDIAQHVTIAPDGGIWTGRDWNSPPASAGGYNGNSGQGPFMFEMVGNFDRGEDAFDGPQREAAILVIAAIQLRFGLGTESLRFHRDMSPKTCPGSGIDYAEVLREVNAARTTIRERSRSVGDAWATPAALASRAVVDQVITASGQRSLDGRAARNGSAADEPAEEEMTLEQQLALLGDADSVRALGATRDGSARDADLTPALLDTLRPHLVNLRQGRFSTGGKVSTTIRDLDAIFAGLERWVAAGEGPRRIVLYAHGGLVSEESGLRVALNHVAWWKANDVYPIYFLWETGFVETLAQMLAASTEREREAIGARDLSDVSDWVIEKAARVSGPAIWGAMKRSAERAFDEEGDEHGIERNARAVLRRLIGLCTSYPDKVELHGVGHSAGSIFQIHLLHAYEAMRAGLTTTERAQAPAFTSLQFLAPAATSELFLRRLRPLIGTTVGHLSIFTMKRSAELDDSCLGIYRKSLLYLVHYSLEEQRETDILGLQECLEGRELSEALDPDGPTTGADIVYSPTVAGSEAGRRASRALHHGGFDEDPWTMTSVLCRLMDLDPGQVKRPYPATTGRALGDVLSDGRRWRTVVLSPVPEPVSPAAAAQTGTATGPAAQPPASEPSPSTTPAVRGRRRAFCVGIDTYPEAPLAGCVNDAKNWANLLQQRFAFEPPTMLVNGDATRERILAGLTGLIGSAQPGEALAFVYAGHGTELPDLDRDESEGTNGSKDEALCPYDYAEGRFLIDDDLRQVLLTIPPGVSLTCFFDCCHSGSATRFAVGLGAGASADPTRKARFIAASAPLIAAHKAFRGKTRGLAEATSSAPGGREEMRHVLFSACMDREVAYEANGAGAFTGHTIGVLQALDEASSNTELLARITRAFGDAPSQHPQLDCAPGWEGYRLFQGAPSRAESAATAAATRPVLQAQPLPKPVGAR